MKKVVGLIALGLFVVAGCKNEDGGQRPGQETRTARKPAVSHEDEEKPSQGQPAAPETSPTGKPIGSPPSDVLPDQGAAPQGQGNSGKAGPQGTSANSPTSEQKPKSENGAQPGPKDVLSEEETSAGGVPKSGSK